MHQRNYPLERYYLLRRAAANGDLGAAEQLEQNRELVGFVLSLYAIALPVVLVALLVAWVGSGDGPFSHQVCETYRDLGTAGKNSADVSPLERQYPEPPSSSTTCNDVGPWW